MSDSGVIPSSLLNADLEDFFRGYWQTPIPLQGVPPSAFTEKEASISPEACGSCHTKQYADWKKSLHSKAMGPGPWGQIIDLTQNSAGDAVLCMTCHAPLSEQMPFLVEKTNSGRVSYVANPYYDPQLQVRGIVCAACHVRQHQRFGPPKAEKALATHYPAGMPKHGGVQRTPFFEKAEFCKGCHQFDPENTVLINGKPIQDTYREWKQSTWGQGGAACQDCHMPDRRHLWKGIHDAEWVRNGVRIDTRLKRHGLDPGRSLELQVEVLNSAVGHKFPTYLTPKVFVRASLLDGMGRTISGTKKEGIIGWDARFEGGRWKEYFDTRIAPGAKSKHIFHWTPSSQAKKIRAWVEVYPDHFYHFYFYPVYLRGEGLSKKGRQLEQKALEASGRSSYILFERIIPLS
ncbi:MAG: ammonia-forming cytochrome c nitrite reductase subunit c552 [Candidatus Binatia bacterium]